MSHLDNNTYTYKTIFNKIKSLFTYNYKFSWDTIKLIEEHNLELLDSMYAFNSTLTNKLYVCNSKQTETSLKLEQKYLDMVYTHIKDNLKDDISSLIPTDNSDAELLNIKFYIDFTKLQTFANLKIKNNIDTSKEHTIIKQNYNNNNATLQQHETSNTVFDPKKYCYTFMKFVEAARTRSYNHTYKFSLDYNCDNTDHENGLYVKYNA